MLGRSCTKCIGMISIEKQFFFVLHVQLVHFVSYHYMPKIPRWVCNGIWRIYFLYIFGDTAYCQYVVTVTCYGHFSLHTTCSQSLQKPTLFYTCFPWKWDTYLIEICILYLSISWLID